MKVELTFSVEHHVVKPLLAIAALYEGDQSDQESLANDAIRACFDLLHLIAYEDNPDNRFDSAISKEGLRDLKQIAIIAPDLHDRIKALRDASS